MKLPFLSRVRAGVASAMGAFSTTYFSANDAPGVRTQTVGVTRDSRKELTQQARQELVKKSRVLYNNLGVYKKFVNGLVKFSVGRGIVHIPATKDDNFNTLADDYFDTWALSGELRGIPFWKLQKYMGRELVRDGDSLALKVDNGPGVLQWIDPLAVANLGWSSGYNGVDADGFRDGVLVNAVGQRLEYSLLKDARPNAFDLSERERVPASAIIHAMDYERSTSIRGVPWVAHGQNSALDIMDLLAFEKIAVKLHGMVAASIKKKSGDAGKGGFGGDLLRVERTGNDGKRSTVAYDNFAGGAAILNLNLDEEFELISSDRPNSTFSGFLDYLVRDMAAGLGVSFETFWNIAALSGPSARFVIEDANWLFEEVQDLIVDAICRPVYVWVIARAIVRGELPQPTDPQWWRCNWQGPAKLSIDEGRLGQLELEQINAGVGTEEIFWGKRGLTGSKMMRKRVDEIAAAMEYCKSKNVPYEFYRVFKPGTPAGGAVGEDPQNPQDPNPPGNTGDQPPAD